MELNFWEVKRRNVSSLRPCPMFCSFIPYTDSGLADDIATCLNLALTQPETAQTNPENYVFFIAHMFHMRGEDDGDEPWSIPRQWDFRFEGQGQNRIFGAFENPL